jgi:small subunit ribosomal protein S17
MQDETRELPGIGEDETRELPETGEADATLPPPVETSATSVQVLSGAAGRAVRGQELRPGQEKRRQMKVGRVVSDKMDKTVIVAVEYTRQHPLYKKAMKRTSRFAAHDENNECNVGDVVRIEETRPLSKTKRWIVREIIQRRVIV